VAAARRFYFRVNGRAILRGGQNEGIDISQFSLWRRDANPIASSSAKRSARTELLNSGKHSVRKLKRTQAADTGVGDEAIANSTRRGGSSVYQTKPRFVPGNLAAALTTEKAWATQLTLKES